MSATNILTQGNREHGAEMYIKGLEIPLKQIVTIGDMSSGDVLMFRYSGVSIAMGNASADLQREATFVTISNEEEGSPTRWNDSSFGSKSDCGVARQSQNDVETLKSVSRVHL